METNLTDAARAELWRSTLGSALQKVPTIFLVSSAVCRRFYSIQENVVGFKRRGAIVFAAKRKVSPNLMRAMIAIPVFQVRNKSTVLERAEAG